MKKFKRMAAVLFLLLITGFFTVACDDSGGSDSEKPSIYGTWTTTNAISQISLVKSCALDINSGATISLNSDKTFSYSYSGRYYWSNSSAPQNVTKVGNFSFSSDDVFKFSFADGYVLYNYTVKYSELTSNSVKLECTMVTTRTDDATISAVTDTFTFTCQK